MAKELGKSEIMENLKLLSEWLYVKYPGEVFEVTVVGGAAMALNGFKEQTRDVDLLVPDVLPEPLKKGVAHISRARALSPEWLNTNAANIFKKQKKEKKLPRYFREISRTIVIGKNLKVRLMGRRGLIAMKLYAASPSFAKHTTDLKKLRPNKEEMEEAVRFVLNMDDHETRRQDLGTILKQIGFDADEILQQIDKPR